MGYRMKTLTAILRFLVICSSLFAGCLSATESTERKVRLAEPRIVPLQESEWNEGQSELLSPLKKYSDDGVVPNCFYDRGQPPQIAWQLAPVNRPRFADLDNPKPRKGTCHFTRRLAL